MSTTLVKPNPMLSVFALPDYRLLLSGTALSLLGDQFALIATPWLVLQLTGDPLVLGGVLAATGLPRAAFMLIGGAITDRLSPRLVMLVADIVRLGLTALMSFAVLTGTVEIWMVFAFGLGFGTVAGFAVPAENSIVPRIVKKHDLQAGNALMMGAGQLAGFIGPSLAGIVIGTYVDSLFGVAVAYGVDALSFAISALCLFLIRGVKRDAADAAATEGVFAAIRTAFFYIFEDSALRLVFLILAAINFLLIGPLLIGIPLVASTRLPEGAVAFGMLMSAFSAGSLVGFVLAGALPRPGAGTIKLILIALLIAFSLVVAALGFIPWTGLDVALMLLLGVGDGYIAILLFTWMQTRTPEGMLGRVMGFLMFANSGLVPLSQALSGAVGKWNLEAMLLIAGGLCLLVTFWAATRPELAAFSGSLAEKSNSVPEGA
ncbi:MAG: MFS transporter [Alphaproteobacteria bacterium]|nr:MFS transporter [Alphaproteobacteria bacterium]